MNHRIFERKLRSWVHLGACLSECHVHLCSATKNPAMGDWHAGNEPFAANNTKFGRLSIWSLRWFDKRIWSHSTRETNNWNSRAMNVLIGVWCLLDYNWSSERSVFIDRQVINFWPQIRQDYPLNLSILISGGRETNKDSLSNGEWSGKSSNLKSLVETPANCSLENCFRNRALPKFLGKGHRRGWESRAVAALFHTRRSRRVGLFGNAAQNGW